jgi:ATP-binding cassette subfamily C protein
MGREHLADAVLQKKIESLKKVIKKQVYAGTALSAFRDPVTIAFLAAGLYWVLVIWKLSVASVLVIIYMLQKVMKRVNKIQTIYQNLVVKESAYWSLTAKIEAASQMEEAFMGNQKVSLRHSLCLENVSFNYADERWILKDASLEFPAGSFTAIVGPSGIGKTTVVDLVTGLLRPQAGEILVDNIPLTEIDIRYWRQMIGYVPQETLLLNDAILLNITLGDKQLSMDDVEYALKAAGAWEFVQTMPKGIHTMVGEQGYKLSGGQRQRIAIARALVHQPQLLILDEATTALDPKNEAAICETLRSLKGKHTLLAISHQPAILKVAERAYRLEDGKALLVTDLLSQIHHEMDLSSATA